MSPLQSPSLTPSDSTVSQEPLKPKPKHVFSLPALPRGQKHTRSELAGQKEERSHSTNFTKRQRRETATARRKQELVPAKKSAQRVENHVNVRAIEAKEEMDPRSMSPKPPQGETALPWILRSRNVTSYCATGTRISTGNRGWQEKISIEAISPSYETIARRNHAIY